MVDQAFIIIARSVVHCAVTVFFFYRNAVGCSSTPPSTGAILMQLKLNSTATSFDRSWSAFKSGFGDPSSDYFWLGNDALHSLTQSGSCKLVANVLSAAVCYTAIYTTFVVADESAGYQLQVGETRSGM